MKLAKILTYTFLIFNLCVLQLLSEENTQSGTIRGRLIDNETKSPLIGANVEVLNTQMGAATDMDGYYIINNVPCDNYSLRFSYVGYDQLIRTDVIVRSKRISYVNSELSTSVMETEVITVNAGYFAKAEEQPTSLASFTSEEIRRAPGSAGDVSRIIYGLPSVAKVNDTKNSLIVRGGSALENAFYIDNIEINNINHFPEQGSSGGPIGMLNVDFIEDVNFYSGGFSSNYGDRLSSVMELRFREGNRDEFDSQLDLSFGGFGGSAEGPLSNGKGSWMISARRSFLDFIVGAIGEDAASVPQYGDLQAKMVYDLTPFHQLTFLNIGGLDVISHKRKMAEEEKMNMYDDFQILQNTFGLNWRYVWGKKGYSNTSISYSFTDYDFSIFDTQHHINSGTEKIITKQNSMEREYRIRNINHFKINDSNKLDFGLETKIISVDYNNFYGPHTDYLGNQIPAVTVEDKKSAAKIHGFVGYTWRPFKKLTLSPGVRVGHFIYNSNTNISPRFSASYQFTNTTALNFSSGIYYQNLPLVLLSQSEEHKKMRDPNAYHYILGLSHLLTENTRLTLEVYDKKYYNFPMDPDQPELFIIDEMHFTGMFLPHKNLVDNGRAHSQGIELMVQKKLAEDFYGMISTSYFRSKFLNYNNEWNNRIVDNRFTFNVEGGYKPNNKWEFSTRWIYAGGAPYTPFDIQASETAQKGIFDANRINKSRMPDYHSLNIRFDRRYFFDNSNIVFYLSVWNAYGRENIGSYQWNEIDNKQEAQKQWSTLPIFGVEFEF